MDAAEFKTYGKQMVDYIVNYLENIDKRRVIPAIEPGYLRKLLPDEAPDDGEPFEKIMHDVDAFIMPGVTHWQHPRFHAYFPAGNSYPSILADMLSDAIGAMGFSWAACPALTELEVVMMDWYGKMLGLPPEFLPFTKHGKGGGAIQGSASECILYALLAARFQMMKKLKQKFPFLEERVLLSKFVAYASKEAHCSVEKACMIAMVRLKSLPTDENESLRGETLRNAIAEDRETGLIPFFVSATLGTTSCCSFDRLTELGPICKSEDIWMHVDGAYGGSAFVCPEMRHLMAGIEHAMSFNTNPNKWLLVNFDCSAMWVRNRFRLSQAFSVDPLYLQHSWMEKAIDLRHWGIPLSRRFRALKLWFVFRSYGVRGLQKYIREHVRLAKVFEAHVMSDERFEVTNIVCMGLVCFRLKGENTLSSRLLYKLNLSGKLHMVPASLKDCFVIRFCVCRETATDADMEAAWRIIRLTADEVFLEQSEASLSGMKLDDMVRRKKSIAGDDQLVAAIRLADGTRHPLARRRSLFTRFVSDPDLMQQQRPALRRPRPKAEGEHDDDDSD